MRCEPWMNETPVPKKTPLQIAQDDMRYWKQRMEELQTQLDAARKEFSEAVERVLKLNGN